jgi:hypothetical protein
MIIRCQSYHGDYAYSYGGAAMSGSDGTYSITQVPVVRVHSELGHVEDQPVRS